MELDTLQEVNEEENNEDETKQDSNRSSKSMTPLEKVKLWLPIQCEDQIEDLEDKSDETQNKCEEAICKEGSSESSSHTGVINESFETVKNMQVA